MRDWGKKIIFNLAAGALFGAAFWYFLELIQAGLVESKFSCCQRCGNILYEVEQPILAFCAGLSFFGSAFLPVRGWKVILKTFAISILSFEIYWAMTFWAGIHYEECTALNYPRGLFPILGGIAMEFEVLVWAVICTIVFLIFNQCRKVFVPEVPEDFRVDRE